MISKSNNDSDRRATRVSISPEEKRDLVLRALRGEKLESIAATSGRTRSELRNWKADFLGGGLAGLVAGRDGLQQLAQKHRELRARVAELAVKSKHCDGVPARGRRARSRRQARARIRCARRPTLAA